MSDFSLNELAESLDSQRVIELVTQLGADRYIEKDKYIIFPTICHNVDSASASMKLYYYKNTKIFVCYTDCGEGFNIFKLFEKRYTLLNKDYNFYQDIVLVIGGQAVKRAETGFYQVYESEYEKYITSFPEVNLPIISKKVLNSFIFSPRPEWLNDGISEEAMKHYNILYSIEQNKIIIPHYNIDNELIGIRGRALNEEDLKVGKYMPIQIENKIYSHPLTYNLYGLNIVKDNIKKYKMAIVAESEKAVLQYETMFGADKNICVGCCGSKFHSYQFDLLQQCGAERILIAFDKEGENWTKSTKYYEKLHKICDKYKYKCQMGFIWDSKNLLKLKESPFDKGKETLRQLIQGGIWI